MTADRHLLFGLLALQNGIIDQDQLLAAFRAWTLDRSKSLAEHLALRGDLDEEGRAAIEALAARHLKRHGGDVEQSLAALNAGRSTRESWHASPTATSRRRWPTSARPRSNPPKTPTAPPATASVPRLPMARGSVCCGRMPAV